MDRSASDRRFFWRWPRCCCLAIFNIAEAAGTGTYPGGQFLRPLVPRPPCPWFACSECSSLNRSTRSGVERGTLQTCLLECCACSRSRLQPHTRRSCSMCTLVLLLLVLPAWSAACAVVAAWLSSFRAGGACLASRAWRRRPFVLLDVRSHLAGTPDFPPLLTLLPVLSLLVVIPQVTDAPSSHRHSLKSRTKLRCIFFVRQLAASRRPPVVD